MVFEQKFDFSLVICVHMQRFDFDFYDFLDFFIEIFLNWPPNPFIELLVRTCPATFLNSLYLLITFFVLHKSRFPRLTSDLRHSVSTECFLNAFRHWSTQYSEYGQSQ